MDKHQARKIIKETFESPFEKSRFTSFVKNLLNQIEDASFTYQGIYIPDAYKPTISSLERIGKYSDGEHQIDILFVQLKKETSLERARTMQRNFIAWYLNGSRGGELKDAALVAFVSPGEADWRFSLVKMDYRFEESENGKVRVKEEFTPARRWSFLVGSNEASHTAQSRLMPIVADDEHNPTLKQLENAFDIETVGKEFFLKYRDLFIRTKEELDKFVASDAKVRADFEAKGVDTVNFAKKLLGQIVFLYFLQKKGWFGVERDKEWGTGSKRFLRDLFDKEILPYDNFFNKVLEPLFYDALARDKSDIDHWNEHFKSKIPFLNGGLFDPIGNYDWVHTDINIPNELFSNTVKTKEGDIGNGILDIFDRYNFTVKEDEPLEKEVAIDPEMLGKAYEKFNAIRPDNFEEYKATLKSGQKGSENKFNKKFGVYYTPREIVHYMCQQSLIYYLHTELNKDTASFQRIGESQTTAFGNEGKKGQLDLTAENRSAVEKADGASLPSKEEIETLIKSGEQLGENEAVVLVKEKNIAEGKQQTTTLSSKLPKSIRENAGRIDYALANITVCDPAIGSGAFPVGMMHEIVKTRNLLSTFIEDPTRTIYSFKRQCIEKSLYGVDIDPGAVEIAKLRLWLSLVVDEEDIRRIKPLPNLDYKIVCGNSLLGVEKNLFNNELFIEQERLKPLYFNETNPTKKQEYKKQIDEIINEITNGHDEFDFEVNLSEVFHEKGGFDVVIANPPYVGEKGNEEIFHKIARTELGKKFYSRWMDYFYYFFHRSLDICNGNGGIAFITTNYYLTATGAKKLRGDLKQRSIVKNLINFNELRIFESAKGQHNMLTILHKGKGNKGIAESCSTHRRGNSTPQILASIFGGNDTETYYYSIPQTELFEGPDYQIRLTGYGKNSQMPIVPILAKMKSQTYRVGDVCHVLMGLVSRADKVNASHFKTAPGLKAKKGDGIFVLTSEELKRLRLPKEDITKYVRPFYKNSNIAKYYSSCMNQLWLLYMKDEGKPITLSRAMKGHFSKYENLLTRLKENFLKNEIASVFVKRWLANGNYFVLFNPKKEEYFTTPKIIAPYRSKRNTFAYNETPWFASQDVCYILPQSPEFEPKYLLAFLNSNLCFKWLQFKGKRKGDILELYKKPISEIPIRKISKDNQRVFVNAVDRILAITKDNDYLQNPQKQARVKVLEQEIDQMVYKLYGLTEEEIRIVEGEK